MGKPTVAPYNLLLALVLVALTLVAFWPTLSNGFVSYDDDKYVTANPHVRAGPSVETVTWAFTTFRASNWHPLTWLSHSLDCRFYGMNPLGHHLTNLLLHTANVLLLFAVLLRMTTSRWRSALVAALFAIHPLHVESVAWVAERKDVLSAFFWMLTMLAYVRYAEKPSGRRYLPVLIAFGIGLLAKPMLVTLPFVLFLLDRWPLNRARSTMHLVLEKVPLVLMAAGSSIITFVAQHAGGSVAGLEISPAQRIGNALVSYACYIGKTVWPGGLACFYPRVSLPAWQPLLAGMALLGVTVLIIRMAGCRPHLLTGWLWYIGTLVPVIGLVQVGMQSMADRYTYIPLIGLFIMVAWGIPERMEVRELGSVGERAKGRMGDSIRHSSHKSHPSHSPTKTDHPEPTTTMLMVAALVLAVLGTCTNLQCRHWHDSESLFRRAIAVTEGNYIACNNLGQVLTSQGRYDDAIALYRKGLETDPDPGLAYNNLGAAYAETCRFQEAMDCFRRSVESDPECVQGHTNLGRGLAMQGKYDEAMQHLSTALKLDPENPMAHLTMGEALCRQNKLDQAISEFQQAVRLQPDLAAAHYNLAVAYYTKGHYATAWQEVRLAQRHGFTPSPSLLQALSQRMPEPR